ncbi:larval cuticle protein 1-like [Ctenocephalides felis]|uniref:larval cuticle protein 1-like n=1 Tax=Ctenocephalides felis TaxID=7515 RepID=UPI000E6E3810|nr:larval cuticle protein 1-like [Ctenocephalides felis]
MHSTIEQTHRLVHKINETLQEKKYCSALFLDTTQAFDKAVIIFFVAVTVGILGAPVDDYKNAKIIKYENTPFAPDNGYRFEFKTSDGQSRKEEGAFVRPDQILTVKGSYSYTDTNGKLVEVSYKADDKGFLIVPESDMTVSQRLPPGVIESLLG